MKIDEAKIGDKLIEMGKRLKTARELAGLSVGQAGKLYREYIGGGDTVITLLENGIDICMADVLILAEIYSANLAWLTTGTNPNFNAQEIADKAAGRMSPEDLASLLSLLEVISS